MKIFAKNIFIGLLGLIIIASFFSAFVMLGDDPAVVTIDELVRKIKNGEVSRIMVNGENLNITLKDNTLLSSKKESEAGLTETLNNFGVNADMLQGVAIGIEEKSGLRFWLELLIPSLLPLIIIIAIFWLMFRQAKTGINQAFTFGRSGLRLFTGLQKERITFNDVAGLKEAKEELREVVDFLKNPKKYTDIGAEIPRGVLLVGQPGTGKTLLARAVAGESGVPFFYISASEFVEMFVGVGASRTRDAFLTAKRAAPSILFIDEIDAVGRERGTGLGGGHDEREQTLNQILVEMDGFDHDTKVIVLAATNRPDVLDKALLRPGRFDRRVVLDLPDIRDREEILKIHARTKKLPKDIDFHRIALRTPGFSGADLANLVNEAALFAARHNRTVVTQQDFHDSIERVILGPERRTRVISDKEKEMTAYHEAGHALIAVSLKDTDPVHKVSIVSRGMAGGYTLKLPSEDVRLRTRAHFLSDLAVMLGGYAAEGAVFGDISTGASNDLKEASALARSLVTRYGMSKLGPITFGKTDELVFFGREISSEKNYSEAVATRIDNEIERIIKNALKVAEKIIAGKRNVLEAIAKALTEKETLEHEDFYALVKRFVIKPIAVPF